MTDNYVMAQPTAVYHTLHWQNDFKKSSPSLAPRISLTTQTKYDMWCETIEAIVQQSTPVYSNKDLWCLIASSFTKAGCKKPFVFFHDKSLWGLWKMIHLVIHRGGSCGVIIDLEQWASSASCCCFFWAGTGGGWARFQSASGVQNNQVSGHDGKAGDPNNQIITYFGFSIG